MVFEYGGSSPPLPAIFSHLYVVRIFLLDSWHWQCRLGRYQLKASRKSGLNILFNLGKKLYKDFCWCQFLRKVVRLSVSSKGKAIKVKVNELLVRIQPSPHGRLKQRYIYLWRSSIIKDFCWCQFLRKVVRLSVAS